MGDYNAVSGIKVLDRAIAIMLAAANHPSSLNDLCETTGLPRATTHRLATALEAHQILTRTPDGKWTTGPGMPGNRDNLLNAAGPIMEDLLELTGESVQLFQLTGTTRTCIATREPSSGLHNIVPVGRQLPLTHGSAARVIAAHTDVDTAAATFTAADIETARTRGYAESFEEREAGVASISAPVLNANGSLLAVLSLSGSAEHFRRAPIDKWATALINAANAIAANA